MWPDKKITKEWEKSTFLDTSFPTSSASILELKCEMRLLEFDPTITLGVSKIPNLQKVSSEDKNQNERGSHNISGYYQYKEYWLKCEEWNTTQILFTKKCALEGSYPV